MLILSLQKFIYLFIYFYGFFFFFCKGKFYALNLIPCLNTSTKRKKYDMVMISERIGCTLAKVSVHRDAQKVSQCITAYGRVGLGCRLKTD